MRKAVSDQYEMNNTDCLQVIVKNDNRQRVNMSTLEPRLYNGQM